MNRYIRAHVRVRVRVHQVGGLRRAGNARKGCRQRRPSGDNLRRSDGELDDDTDPGEKAQCCQ